MRVRRRMRTVRVRVRVCVCVCVRARACVRGCVLLCDCIVLKCGSDLTSKVDALLSLSLPLPLSLSLPLPLSLWCGDCVGVCAGAPLVDAGMLQLWACGWYLVRPSVSESERGERGRVSAGERDSVNGSSAASCAWQAHPNARATR